MKHLQEMPNPEDYYACNFLCIDQQQFRLSNPSRHQKDLIFKNEGIVNFINIIDCVKHIVKIDVVDEEKFTEFQEADKKWQEKMEQQHKKGPFHHQTTPSYLQGHEMPINQEMRMNNMSEEIIVPEERFPEPEPFQGYNDRPTCPIKTITLDCTLITYFTGIQRIVCEPFSHFKEQYFNYLQREKLSMR